MKELGGGHGAAYMIGTKTYDVAFAECIDNDQAERGTCVNERKRSREHLNKIWGGGTIKSSQLRLGVYMKWIAIMLSLAAYTVHAECMTPSTSSIPGMALYKPGSPQAPAMALPPNEPEMFTEMAAMETVNGDVSRSQSSRESNGNRAFSSQSAGTQPSMARCD